MKKSLIALAALAALGTVAETVRARTHDVSFTYRMGGGFPGDVNRTHPASVVAGLMDANDPIAFYGFPALFDAADNTYRAVTAADQGTVTSIAGVLVRPFPVQQTSQTSMNNSPIGSAAAPTSGVVDVLDDGFILVKNNNNAAAGALKGGAVYVWAAASAGAHVLGGFEASASAGNTIKLTNAEFTGPADANGVTEIRVWKAART